MATSSGGAVVPRLESTFAIGKFVEKPDRPNAERMLASGDYYWNSGMFLLKASVFLQELQTHKPEVLRCRAESTGSQSQ